MGIFHDMVQVRNLAPIPLNITYDGQTTSIPPGVCAIPKITLINAMNQNPIMGTADAWNPHVSGGKFLIVEVNSEYDRKPLTEEEWNTHLGKPSRMDEEAYFADTLDPKQRVVTRGKGRKMQARSVFEAGVRAERTASIDSTAGDK